MTRQFFIRLILPTVLLALLVVVLGAYVRLSDAGLGCPDWPGCYGKMIVPGSHDDAHALYPDRPLEQGKAWKEMLHRYAAGTLGLLIFFIGVLSWKYRAITNRPPAIPLLLIVLVVFQALLGMWTVTLLLKPLVVLAHLLGGMTILALLMWILLDHTSVKRSVDINNTRIFPWALAGLAMVFIQIALGGWTSSNYAALACPDLPTCQGEWWPAMNFIEGFRLWHGLGVNYEFGILAGDARTAIHMVHRIGAVFTLVVVGAVAIRTISDDNKTIMQLGLLLLLVLAAQIALGVSNVLLRLPLPVAVGHNCMAALLLLNLVALLHFSFRPGINRRKRE